MTGARRSTGWNQALIARGLTPEPGAEPRLRLVEVDLDSAESGEGGVAQDRGVLLAASLLKDGQSANHHREIGEVFPGEGDGLGRGVMDGGLGIAGTKDSCFGGIRVNARSLGGFRVEDGEPRAARPDRDKQGDEAIHTLAEFDGLADSSGWRPMTSDDPRCRSRKTPASARQLGAMAIASVEAARKETTFIELDSFACVAMESISS